MGRPITRHLLAFSSLLILMAASGCDRRQARTNEAFASYQAAAASGDLAAIRMSLQQLIAIDDSHGDWWLELGRVNLQMADFGAAYSAFVRAHELDRDNAEVLSIMTQLALRSGNIALAEEHARQLELLSPNDLAVSLTWGYLALRRGDAAEANRQAELILANSPNDPSGKILRARVLVFEQKTDEAIELLRAQLKMQPSDQLSMQALLGLYEFKEDWTNAALTGRALVRLRPAEVELRARLIDSELQAGSTDEAVTATVAGLREATPLAISRLLHPWLTSSKIQAIVPAVTGLAREASGDRRIAMLRFLSQAGQSREVAALARDQATLPAVPANLAANALFATAQTRMNEVEAGLDRLNEVLAVDNRQVDALRGRAELRSRAGEHAAAIEDARKLVAADKSSPIGRLLLARIYLAAGDADGARRTLWEAFHDLPADRSVYEALRALLLRLEGPLAAQRLARDFEDQKTDKMTRSFA